MSISDNLPDATWTDYGVAAGKIVIFGVLVAALWSAVNRVTRFDDHEQLFVRHNRSYLIQRCGLLIGQGVAMWPLLGSTGRPWPELAWVAGGGLWAAALLGLLWPVLNRLVGHGDMTDPADPVEQSTSLVRAGFFVASGAVIGAGLSGSSPSVAVGIAATVVFTLLGLVVLYAAYRLNGVLPQFDRLSRHVARGNLAAAIIAAGFTVALGLVLHKAIAGDFTGWGSGLAAFAMTAVLATAGFYLVSWLMDRFIITSATLAEVVRTDQRLAATATAALLVTVAAAVAALPV
ncbi:DUF350 domain-containing protein [Plantactinospora siamensis]|uniref:DUF350 domain-containing protein n=1 Tax=Plantactinospora siamensis TaxID=555372 RepID=A0ABV6P4K3_9ACTN